MDAELWSMDYADRVLNGWGVELGKVSPLERAAPYVSVGTDAHQFKLVDRASIQVLLLLDVIEHLPEPVRFIKSLLLNFPNVSHLLITVPARNELWSNYDEFFRHYRRYDMDMLRQMAVEQGWRMIKVTYFFHFLYLAIRFHRLFFNIREVRLTYSKGIMQPIHYLVAYLSIVDYFLIPDLVYGSSLLCSLHVSDVSPQQFSLDSSR